MLLLTKIIKEVTVYPVPEKIAIDFLTGDIRIMPLSYYRNIEDKSRRDEMECKDVEYRIQPDISRCIQYIPTFDGILQFFPHRYIEEFPKNINKKLMFKMEDINPAILCTSKLSENPQENVDIISNLIKSNKGRYMTIFSGDFLYNRIYQELQKNEILKYACCASVRYRKDKVGTPFEKLEEFRYENEYRFLFPEIHQEYHLHLGRIPGIILDLKDNCRRIFSTIEEFLEGYETKSSSLLKNFLGI